MSHARKALGKWGEDQAVMYLQRKGLEIIARNWRTAQGEIDLVARDGRTLVFVEVRTRSGQAFGLPAESVDWRKRRKLREMALCYLQKEGVRSSSIRFDVIGVLCQKGKNSAEIIHVEQAF
ncbi:YraN family protein [Brevibacillus sp. SYP-B805]|uniref:YraN family protein n=1 Tax=Brevibacillus sp. SYP-B805 TaxID=1578199 RepID=UPI0013EACC82|nr:YraN family protein [Brevibacillus sp. SYP-B805]